LSARFGPSALASQHFSPSPALGRESFALCNCPE
jgi:hypothetical protein